MKTEIKTRKTVALCGGAEAHVNLLNGENIVSIPTIADEEMGIEISHILHQNGTGENTFCCGNNLRLNLHEKFVKNENPDIDANYIYTDCMGDTYKFKEYFYYVGDDKLKRRITRDNVSVLEDGTLTYNDGTNTYIVEREITTYDGMKASAKLEGVKNLQNYEQRSEELKQAEEQSQSYKDVLNSYVITDEIGNIKKQIGKNNVTLKVLVDEAKNASCLLSKNDAISLRYLHETQIHLVNQTEYDFLLKRSKTNTRNIDKMIKDAENCDAETCFSYAEAIYDYVIYNSHENTVSEILLDGVGEKYILMNSSHLENGKMFNKYYTSGQTAVNFVLHRTELANYYSSVAQLVNVRGQIENLKETSKKNKAQINEYYSEYLDLEEKARQLRFQSPVSFVMSEKGARGFNENGDLVVMYNKNGDYIAFEYERYFAGNDEKYRIAKIYDSKEKVMNLVYNNKSNLLCEITNSNGETVRLEHSDDTIKHIFSPNGYTLRFDFEAGALIITDSYAVRNEILLTDKRVSQITKSTKVTSVTNGSVAKGAAEYQEIFNNTFSYDTEANTTTITDDTKVKHIYVFDPATERLINYFKEKNNVAIEAEKYVFVHENGLKYYETTIVNKASLYGTPYTSIVFNSSTTFKFNQKIFNEFNKLIREDNTTFENNNQKRIIASFKYSIEDKLVEKRLEVILFIPSKTTVKNYVELYEYNSFGSLARKQSYVEGEEATNGIDIEEHIYDKNGNEIRAIKYNSLDPSSKLYTEREYDENGRVSAELDATGKYKTSYEYENGTSTVLSEIYPNGSCLSYGYSDIDGNSAISISTRDGEENSIQVMRTNGLATKVKANDLEFGYAYDYKGRTTSIDMNGLVLANMEYDENEAIKVSSVYEKGEETITTSDLRGNVESVVKVAGDSSKSIVNTYDEKDRISGITETANGIVNSKEYVYDDLDRVTTCLHRINDSLYGGEGFTYDNYGTVSQKSLTTVNGNTTYNYTYSDDSKRRLTQVQMVEDNIVIEPKSDSLGRNVGKAITVSNNHIINDRISYLKNGSHATNIPVAIEFADKKRISYKYDRMGNIVKIFENGILSVEYEYDKLGRLTRENNKKLNETSIFKYDNRGNILSKSVYAYTHKVGDELEDVGHSTFNYRYSPLDYLCEFGVQTIINDVFTGKPYCWRSNDIVWNGKEMVGYGSNTFMYDAMGRRILKNNITFDYDVNGKLVRQSNGIFFIYDHNSLIGFRYENSRYFYRRDILGNIIAIIDNIGNIVVEYTYDAWGNHVSKGNAQIAAINPYRYRGYYYDTETGLYFLKTRYYDPAVGRFISMDDVAYIDPETIGGLNLFAYCNNNPVMNFDPSGHSPEWWQWLVSGLEITGGIALCFVPGWQGFGVTLIATGVGSMINGYINESNGGSFGAGWWGGQISGFISAIPGIGVPLGTFVGSVTTDWIDYGRKGIDWNKALVTSLIAWGASIFPTMIGELASKYKIYDKAIYFVNTYNTILASTANSIVNVYWRG